jgi:uncharacterized caspase-like protein
MINRILFRFACAALFAGMLSAQSAFAQDQRVALVIGNSDYKNVFPLKNPVNDAADVGAALSRIGFKVTTLTNATTADMKRALKEFGAKAKLSEVAVVFYSGHALQSDSVAWLLATDGQARSLADVTKTSLSLPEILDQLDGVEKIGMVFIDAARNDPFNEAQKRQLPSGLKRQVEEPKNVLVSFATGAGRKVGDGDGRNSPFTAALLKHIEEPGLEVIALMKRVRNDVVGSTAGEQVPSFYISAADEAYFVAALPKPEPGQPEPPAAAPAPAPAPAAPQAVTPEAPAAPAPAPQVVAPEAPAAPAPAPQVVAPEAPAAPAPAPQALAPQPPLEPAAQPVTPVTPPAAEPAPAAPAEKAAEPAPAAPVEKAAEAPQAVPAPAPTPAPSAEADKPAADTTSTSTEPGDKAREGSDSTDKKNPND